MSKSLLTESNEIINETGKTLHQWFTELERRGFECIYWRKQVQTLAADYQLDLVWAEKIAEAFCSECGLPWKDEATKGFEVLVTKTFHHPLAHVQELSTVWFERERRAILQKRGSKNGSTCYQWITDDSTVSVKLEAKGAHKTRLVVQHQEMASNSDAEIMRNFWKQHLPSMIETL